MTTHPSFSSFVEAQVLPLRHQLRLDGATSGGNREVFGRFRRLGTTWKVHADSHTEPLLMAYEAEKQGRDALCVGSCSTGRTLELVDALQKRRATRFKHLYIYEQP